MNPETRAHAEEMNALAIWLEERTSDTMKAAEAMAPEELAEDVAFLQDVRHKLGLVERDLTIALGQKMGKGTGSLADGRMFTVERSSTRTEWDHDDWKRDARRAVVQKAVAKIDATQPVLVDADTGEALDISVATLLHAAIADAQAIHGAQSPKSTELKKLGLFASDYAVSKPSGWRFTAVKPHATTDTTTEEPKTDA